MGSVCEEVWGLFFGIKKLPYVPSTPLVHSYKQRGKPGGLIILLSWSFLLGSSTDKWQTFKPWVAATQKWLYYIREANHIFGNHIMLWTSQYSPTDCCRAPGLPHSQDTLQARKINREIKCSHWGEQNQSRRWADPKPAERSGEPKGLLLSQTKCGCNLSTLEISIPCYYRPAATPSPSTPLH